MPNNSRQYAAVAVAMDSILLHAELWGITPAKAAAESRSHHCSDPVWEVARAMVREGRIHREIPEYWNRNITRFA